MSAPQGNSWKKAPAAPQQRQGYQGGPAAAAPKAAPAPKAVPAAAPAAKTTTTVPIWAQPAPQAAAPKQPVAAKSTAPPPARGPAPAGNTTAATPFFGSFVGPCTQCKQNTQVSRHAQHGTDQYCRTCWGQWWTNQEKDERRILMASEKDALRTRERGVVSWNAISTTVAPATTFAYPVIIEKTENISEVIRKKLMFAYLRHVLPKEKFDEITSTLLISGATVYSAIDLRPFLAAPLRRTVRSGTLEADVELLVGEVSNVTMDVNAKASQELALQYFNVLLGKCMERAGLVRNGRIYVQEDRARVYNDMVVIPGYFASLQMINKAMHLVVHPRTRVQSTATALDWINRRMERDLLGVDVISTYGNRKRSYRVYKVDHNQSPNSTFELKTGASKSFAAYYKEQYGVDIRQPNQPLLWADAEGRILLVPELMLVDSLPNEAKRTLPTRCSRMPSPFAKECDSFLERLKLPEVAAFLNGNGVQCHSALEAANLRPMKDAKIILAGGKTVPCNADFGQRTQDIRISCPRRELSVIAWGAAAKDIAAEIININEQIQGAWKAKGDVKHVTGSEEDADFLDRCKASLPADTNALVICALRNGHSPKGEKAYGALKSLLGQRGIVSHFIDNSKLSTTSAPAPYVHNITKNITTKMGVPIWTTNLVENVPELQGGTVFVGYDVYHDKRTQSSKTGALEVQRRSIAGFVAWFLRADGTWHHLAEVDLHVSRQELLRRNEGEAQPDRAGMTIEQFLKKVFATTVKDAKCARVVVYRDGVGESQLSAVAKGELPQIKAALPPKVELTFLVVQKRIHDRYVQKLAGPKGDFHNIPRGFSIEYAQATFLQVAVDCTLSTSKPVKYVCMTPGGLKPESIQQMTWSLCWLYANWPGSIKVPFVLQCAHKLAYFHGASEDLEPKVHESLKRMPYYL